MPATGEECSDKQDTSLLSTPTPSSTPRSAHLLDSSAASTSTLKSATKTLDISIGSADSSLDLSASSSGGDTRDGSRCLMSAEKLKNRDDAQDKQEPDADATQAQKVDEKSNVIETDLVKNSYRNVAAARARGRHLLYCSLLRRFGGGNPETETQAESSDGQTGQRGRKLLGPSSPETNAKAEEPTPSTSHSQEKQEAVESPAAKLPKEKEPRRLSSILKRSLHNDGILGRYPGDDPKNYNKKVFSPPISHDDGYNGLFKLTRIKTGFLDDCIDRMVTKQGLIAIQITGSTRLYLTANGGIRLINETTQVIVALSPNGGASSLIHPSGKVYQHGSRVEISARSSTDNLLAKMWFKGISFATENGALVYLLDDAGTRTVHDIFSDMSGDFTTAVFLDGAVVGPPAMPRCARLLQTSLHWRDEVGLTDVWEIGGTRVTRTPDDVVRITRGQNKYQLRACGNGLASISTPYIHCTASYGKTGPETSHIFVRRGERRLHYDGTTFILRNGGHSAGFDYNMEFRVF